MKKSGLADSPFFSMDQARKGASHTLPDESATGEPKMKPDEVPDDDQDMERSGETDTLKLQEHDTTIPRHHGTTTPRHHGTTTPGDQGEVIEYIRRELIRFGKEAATHRFTKREKRAIAEIIYVFKKQGLNTSENEITRIAVNFIIDNYDKKGESSILARTLKALNE